MGQTVQQEYELRLPCVVNLVHRKRKQVIKASGSVKQAWCCIEDLNKTKADATLTKVP